VLDLDDTLFLERDYVSSGFGMVGEWVRRKFRIDDFAERAFAHFEAGRRGDIFNTVLRDCERTASDADMRRMVSIYRQHTPKIRPLPDALEFLTFWHGKCAIALISDGPVSSQRRKLAALGLRSYFDTVVFTGIWSHRYAKPHERAFRFVQEHYNNSSMKFFYVADNPQKDFHAPLALGWETVRVRRTGGMHASLAPLHGLEPRFEVLSLGDVTPIVISYLNQ
jgi:putative hydrolase of the HAD superfamily